MPAEIDFKGDWEGRVLETWDHLAERDGGPFRSTMAGYRVTEDDIVPQKNAVDSVLLWPRSLLSAVVSPSLKICISRSTRPGLQCLTAAVTLLVAPLAGSMNFFKGIHLSRTNLKRKTTNEGPKRRSAGQSLTYRPFDNSEFNFTKVADDELIGTFGSGAHAVLVNVSPLAYGHCLLCPNYKDCRPQILSLDALSAAVAFQRSANGERSDMQVTFNSLGAWASVNHLHFHVFWPAGRHPSHSETAGELEGRILDSGGRLILLEQPLFGKMPIELAAPKRVLAKFEYLTLEELDYPAYTFRVTAVGEDGVNLMAAGIWSVVWVLLRLDIPHNIVLSQRATVAFVTPRQPQMISFMQEGFSDGAGLHIACAELGGYIICFDQETYECLTEEDVVRIFGRDINLEDPRMVEEVVASFNRCAV